MPTESVPGGSFTQKSSTDLFSSYAKAGSCCIKGMPATAIWDFFSDWWRCLFGRQENVLMRHLVRERYGIQTKPFAIICSKPSLVMLFARGCRRVKGAKLVVVRRMSMATMRRRHFCHSYFVCVSSVPMDTVCDSRWCVTQIC